VLFGSILLASVIEQIIIIRGYHTVVFISARISGANVNNCPRRRRGQLSTEGLI